MAKALIDFFKDARGIIKTYDDKCGKIPGKQSKYAYKNRVDFPDDDDLKAQNEFSVKYYKNNKLSIEKFKGIHGDLDENAKKFDAKRCLDETTESRIRKEGEKRDKRCASGSYVDDRQTDNFIKSFGGTFEEYMSEYPFDEKFCTMTIDDKKRAINEIYDEYVKKCKREDETYDSYTLDKNPMKHKNDQSFRDNNQFDLENCFTTNDALKKLIQEEVGAYAKWCKDQDPFNKETYDYKVKDNEAKDSRSFKAWQKNNAKDASKCSPDEGAIQAAYKAKVLKFAQQCKEESKYNDAEYHDDSRSISDKKRFSEKASFDKQKCAKSNSRLKEDIRKELNERKKRCVSEDPLHSEDYNLDIDDIDLNDIDDMDDFNRKYGYSASRCVEDSAGIKDRVAKRMSSLASECKESKSGRYLETYTDNDADRVKSIRDLKQFEGKPFDTKRCTVDEGRLRKELSEEIERRKDKCAQETDASYKRDYNYKIPNKVDDIVSLANFNERNPYSTSKCIVDDDKVSGEIDGVLSSRKKKCKALDENFEEYYDEVSKDERKSYRSGQHFDSARPFDQKRCKVDEDRLRKKLVAEIDQRKDKCAKETDATYKRDYNYVLPERVASIGSLERFNKYEPYSTSKCVLDNGAISKAIREEIDGRDKKCKDAGFGSYGDSEIPANIKSLDEYKRTNKFAIEKCKVDERKLQGEIAAEFASRDKQCKENGYAGYKYPAPSHVDTTKYRDIGQYNARYPFTADGCKIDTEAIKKEIADVNAARDKKCKDAKFLGYVKPTDSNPETWKSRGRYERKNPFTEDSCAVDPRKDKYGRYYKNITTEKGCKRVNGQWNAESISRNGRNSYGQCWATPLDAKCSTYGSKDIVTGRYPHTHSELNRKDQQKCDSDSQCKWVGNMSLYPECISKSLVTGIQAKQKSDAVKYPSFDTTNAEQVLYKYWATSADHPNYAAVEGKPGENRCVVQPQQQKGGDEANDPYQNVFPKYMSKVDGTFSLPQSVIHMVMRNIALRSDSVGGNRGILVWHSTGSGKTFTAAAVMQAFWDTPRQIIFASSISNINNNGPKEFHKGLQKFFPEFNQPGNTLAQNLAYVEKLYTKRGIQHWSFKRLWNRIKKNEDGERVAERDHVDLNNAILIIDEVQNLFYPIPAHREDHAALEEYLKDGRKTGNMKIVILTATPGDSAIDATNLLNLVRDPKKPMITVPNIESQTSIDKFKKEVRGLVSYYDASGDDTRFPKLVKADPTYFPMSDEHYNLYLEKYAEFQKTTTKFDKTDFKLLSENKQSHQYYDTVRKYSNMPYDVYPGGFKSMEEYSSKLNALLTNITSVPNETHYVYSAFFYRKGSSQGIRAIAQALNEQYKYSQIGFSECEVVLDRIKKGKPHGLSKGKRFVVVTESDLKPGAKLIDDGDGGFENAQDETDAADNLRKIIDLFNCKENKNGELIHCFLASSKYNEGLDLKNLRNIHLFESLVSMVGELQTIGRGRRFCSHMDLDKSKGEWIVKVHRYFSDRPAALKMGMKSSSRTKEAVEGDIEYMKDYVKKVKAKKGDGWEKKVEAGKGKLEELKVELKTFGKNNKEARFENLKQMVMIDQFIYDDANARFKGLQVVHKAMKEAAIDCKLMVNFHNKGIAEEADKIRCAFE